MPRSAEVKIDLELMSRLEALPIARGGTPKHEPTPAQVAALRRYWKSGRRQPDIAKALGVHANTARRWYRDYIEDAQAGKA